MKIETYIEKVNPCDESRTFLRQFETFQEAWSACSRGDWMLSAAYLLGVDLRALTLAKGLCANTVRHLMTDARSIAAVDAAIALGRGEISKEELEAAAADAYAYATAAYAAAAYATAYAYATAADADAAAAAAAYAATDAYAADAAAYAADAADAAAYAADARKQNRQQTANICREVLTEAVFAALKAAGRGE